MKKALSIIAVILVMHAVPLQAQNLDNPGDYMTAIANAQADMNKKYMAYMSAAAHGRRARKVEKMRQQALESITQSRYKVSELPIYKGDNSLRQGSIDYIKFCFDVFNDDYAKIVNMEEIAEQSFDEMQVYILLQEKAGEKIREAADRFNKAEGAFAAKYNVNLVAGSSELDDKMNMADKLNHYNNQVFLVFFKANWQDGEVTKAINAKKVNDIEQGRNSLIKFAREGLQVLDTLKHLAGDPSLNSACKQVLTFYKKLAENDLPKLTDFFLKQENFEKIKKSFEAKPESKRTQADIDAFNKAVSEVNAAVNTFNQTNNTINNNRKQVLENWEKADKNFNDSHMPHYKA